MSGPLPGAREQGVVLLIALLVLLVLGLLAATMAATSQLQLQMAGNEETRIAALQQALAVVDAVLPAIVAAPLPGGAGYRICATDSPDESCDERTLLVHPDAMPAAGALSVSAVRVAPVAGRLPVMGEATASSTIHYRVAKFDVQVTYDGTRQGLGRASLAQGVLLRLPAAPTQAGGEP